MKTTKIRTYSELIRLRTFEERFDYLFLGGKVGDQTLGCDRIFAEMLYHSGEWKPIRYQIIVRDDGCDLASKDFPIPDGSPIYIHHLNPISIEDIRDASSSLFDPENLVCCSFNTHQAIHFGGKEMLPKPPIERRPGDTCLWKRG